MMITRVYNPTGITSRGPTAADTDYVLEQTPIATVVSPPSDPTPTTQADATVAVGGDAVIDNTAIIERLHVGGIIQAATFHSLNEAVATVDENGVVTRVTDGTVGIITKTPWLNRRTEVTVSRVDNTSGSFVEFVAGSLARHCFEQIMTLIDGRDPAQSMPLFTTAEHETATYVRNPDRWTGGVDLTCFPAVRRTTAGGWTRKWRGCLISPRHVISARHVTFPRVGETLRFVTMDNQVVDREVVARNVIPGTPMFEFDFAVLMLDEDVPASITPAKVIPSNILDFAPSVAEQLILGARVRIPVVMPTWTDDEIGITGLEWFKEGAGDYHPTKFWPYDDPNEQAEWPQLGDFKPMLADGDSGHPLFLLINGELVYVTGWTTFVNGPTLPTHIAAVNTVMANQQGGGDPYQLVTADLSSFTDFSL